MKKFIQNQVAESKLAWPIAIIYATVVWFLAGLLNEGWWLQFVCFGLTTLLMAHLNNLNALIRIYSRMVTTSFLVLSCCACFLFPSLPDIFLPICFVAFYLLLFNSYQDKEATAWVYYAFLCIGLSSLVFPQICYYLPLLWLLTATQLQSLSWRTFLASLLGLVTPYWCYSCWLVWKNDFSSLANHFSVLYDFSVSESISSLDNGRLVTLLFLCMLFITGTIHFIRQQSADKIRIRQLFSIFIWTSLFTITWLCLQPQFYDTLLPILIINISPLAGHFIALTRTKITNVAFMVITAVALLITLYNLWNTSFLF